MTTCLGYQQVATTDTVQTASAFTIPTGTNHVMVQADQENARFTLDGDVPTAGATGNGELLTEGLAPIQIAVENFNNIKFVRAAGSNGVLNVHYYGGRAI